MKWLLIAAALTLTGCASWTPEQWQAFGESFNQSMQEYSRQQEERLRYLQYQRAIQPRPVQCISNRVGSYVYTNCY
jgi:uncharacterized lipoprotein YmbA